MVDVWLVPSESVSSSDLIRQYRGLIAEPELERIARFYFPRDRHTRLVAYAALRIVLACYAKRDPRDWCFTLNAHGRPEIPKEDAYAAIRFSVSHSGGLIALAITLSNKVGVDVEDTRRVAPADFVSLARRFFSSDEALDVERCARFSRRQCFWEYWTLKEAYLKALGTGLSTPLDQASFVWQDDGTLRVALDSAVLDQDRCWCFLAATVPTERRLAIAVQAPSRSVVRTRFFAAVPLLREALLADLAWSSPGRRVGLSPSPEDALLPFGLAVR